MWSYEPFSKSRASVDRSTRTVVCATSPSLGASRADRGFTLPSLLIGFLLSAIVVLTSLAALSIQDRAYIQQELRIEMEDNLRLGSSRVIDTMRVAGYGLPDTNIATWVSWVSGFDAPLKISGSSPATVRAGHCTLYDVAVLSANANAGATSLSITSSVTGKALADLLNTSDMKLINLNNEINAHVMSVGGSSITIDTDPATADNQGLDRGYPAGTPLCRVDVSTFTVAADGDGDKHLYLNQHQGQGALLFAEGITNMTVTTVEANKQFRVTLSAETRDKDPMSGETLTRSLGSDVTRRNES